MSEMDASGIANRPFFRPLSKLPMFNAAETPVADRLARQGINLPCASKMHEGEVESLLINQKKVVQSLKSFRKAEAENYEYERKCGSYG